MLSCAEKRHVMRLFLFKINGWQVFQCVATYTFPYSWDTKEYYNWSFKEWGGHIDTSLQKTSRETIFRKLGLLTLFLGRPQVSD